MNHRTCRFVSICIFVLERTLGYWKWRRKWGMNIWWPLLYWPAQHPPSTSLFVHRYFPSGTTLLREWALRTGAESLPSLTWCPGENMTLDKPRSFHSMKNKVFSFLWGTWPVEYKSEAAGDHRGERSCQRMKSMQRNQTWVGGRGSRVLMTVFLHLDPAMPDAAAHTLGLLISLIFLSQFELSFWLLKAKKYWLI